MMTSNIMLCFLKNPLNMCDLVLYYTARNETAIVGPLGGSS